MYNFRTDLADERRDLYKKANKIENEVDGIESSNEQIGEKLSVSRVKITNENGEKAIGKPQGEYITIDIKKINLLTDEEKDQAANTLANELKKMIGEKIQFKDEILVVGLGNEEVTPDALGPNVTKEIEVTRHILKYLPQYIDENTRPVSAIAPGVLGTTGIETVEIVKGVVENTKPKLLIAIDALSSRSMERISSSIQLSNTGIVPGAGVGNKRDEISQNSLGIPVIAIGIPTVVETAVVVNDALNIFIEKLQNDAKSNDYLNNLKEQDNYEQIKETLIPKNFNFVVTPKEIDELVLGMSKIIAEGINKAL